MSSDIDDAPNATAGAARESGQSGRNSPIIRERERVIIERHRPERRVEGDDIIEVVEEHSSLDEPPPRRKSRWKDQAWTENPFMARKPQTRREEPIPPVGTRTRSPEARHRRHAASRIKRDRLRGGQTYQRPYSEEGQWLSVDVPLAVAPDLREESGHTHGGLSIAAATQRTSEQKVTIEISYTEGDQDWTGLRWIHVQDVDPGLKSLTRHIYTIPAISNEEIVLALRILSDLEAKGTSSPDKRDSITPGIVLRYDSRDQFRDEYNKDLAVTFLSIPYFMSQKSSNVSATPKANTQALLQSLYPYESNFGRDRRQIFSLYSSDVRGEAVFVSQTFAFVFRDVLFTLSEQSREIIQGSILKDVLLDSSRESPSFARVTNPVGDVVLLKIDPVPSFFSLLEQIELRCLDGAPIDFDRFGLCFSDGIELDPTSWLAKTSVDSPAVIDIRFYPHRSFVIEPLQYPPEVEIGLQGRRPRKSYTTVKRYQVPESPVHQFSEAWEEDDDTFGGKQSASSSKIVIYRDEHSRLEPYPKDSSERYAVRDHKKRQRSSYSLVERKEVHESSTERDVGFDREFSHQLVRRPRVKFAASGSEYGSNGSVNLSKAMVLRSNAHLAARKAVEDQMLTKQRPLRQSALHTESTSGAIAEDESSRTLVNDPNYLIKRNKPKIYHFQDTNSSQVKKTSLLIGEAEENSIAADARPDRPSRQSGTRPQFQWGFTWNGKSQSEVRDVSTPIFTNISDPAESMERENRSRRRRAPRWPRLEWREKQRGTHGSGAVVGSNRQLEEPPQPKRKLLALPPADGEPDRSLQPTDSYTRAAHRRRNSLDDSSTGSPVDEMNALAVVPFQYDQSANEISDVSNKNQVRAFEYKSDQKALDFDQSKRLQQDIESAGNTHSASDLKHYRLERQLTGADMIRERPVSQGSESSVRRERSVSSFNSGSGNSWSEIVPPQSSTSDGSDNSYSRYPSSRSNNYRLIDEEAQMERERARRRSTQPSHEKSRAYTRSNGQRRRVPSWEDVSQRGSSPPRLLGRPNSPAWLASYRTRDGPSLGKQSHGMPHAPLILPKCHAEDRRELYTRKVAPFFAWGDTHRLPGTEIKADNTMLESILRDIHDRLAASADGQSRKVYRRSHETELVLLKQSFGQDEVKDLLCDSETPSLFRNLKNYVQEFKSTDSLEMDALVNSLSGWSRRTVELFLPKNIAGKPMLKIWGSLDYSISALQGKIIEDLDANDNHEHRRWMVKDFSQWENITEKLFLPKPIVTKDCTCFDRVFDTKQAAIDHLSDHHFRRRHLPTSRNVLLGRFVTSAQAKLSGRRLLELLRPLENWHSFLHDFHAQMEELALGVATADVKIQKQLKLTVSLVDSFASYVLAHAKADHLITLVDRHYRKKLSGGDSDMKKFNDDFKLAMEDLRGSCSVALDNARTAYHQVVVLSSVETRIGAIELNSVSLPSIVAGLLAAAQSTVFANRQDAVTHYEGCVAKLQYQVNQHPRKKLLHHIHQLEEELRAVRQTIEISKVLLRNYARTLRPDSFRITTRSRQSLFVIEEAFLKRTYRLANAQLRALEVLEKRSQGLVAQVKRSVEILEEDHGKAILIFTIITTIFLPLSFMTGFFGMNVSDIRNMSGKQWTFWVAAIPFTSIIASIVLLMAFKGSDLLEAIGPSGSVRLKIQHAVWRIGDFAMINPRRTKKRTDTDLTFASA